jgi:hypothetical protein
MEVMENLSLTIAPTNVTPFVQLDARQGILEFKGRSSPSASLEFYYPIMSSIDRVFTSGQNTLTANFRFEYFNTSSSKCLFDILKRLVQFKNKGMDITINWFYEEDDEDMRETGEDYEDVLGIEFNYIPTEFAV